MLLRNTKVRQALSTLDLHGAASLLKIHPQTLLQKVRSGEIPAAKPGKCWVFIEDDDLIQWLRSQYNTTRDARPGGLALCSLKEKTRNAGGSNSTHLTEKLYDNLLAPRTSGKPKS